MPPTPNKPGKITGLVAVPFEEQTEPSKVTALPIIVSQGAKPAPSAGTPPVGNNDPANLALFIGNSQTHNTTVTGEYDPTSTQGPGAAHPAMGASFAHARVAATAAGVALNWKAYGDHEMFGGSDFDDHKSRPSTQAAIAAQDTGNVVFIQEYHYRMSNVADHAAFVVNAIALIDQIRAADKVPVLSIPNPPFAGSAIYNQSNMITAQGLLQAELVNQGKDPVHVVSMLDIMLWIRDNATDGVTKEAALHTDSDHMDAPALWAHGLAMAVYMTGLDPLTAPAPVALANGPITWDYPSVGTTVPAAFWDTLRAAVAATQIDRFVGTSTAMVSATITAPSTSHHADNASIAFAGSATDGTNVLSAGLVWTSNLDGQIGAGASFNATLSQGNHTITATINDSGQVASAVVSLFVYDNTASYPIASTPLHTQNANTGTNPFTEVTVSSFVQDDVPIDINGFTIKTQPGAGDAIVSNPGTIRFQNYSAAADGDYDVVVTYTDAQSNEVDFILRFTIGAFTWITGEDARDLIVPTPKPAQGVDFLTQYGLKTRRITDIGDYTAAGGGGLPITIRHSYSRRWGVSPDGQYFAALVADGFPWALYNAVTGLFVKTLTFNESGPLPGIEGDSEPHWMNNNTIRYMRGGGLTFEVFDMNVETEVVTKVGDMTSVVSVNGNIGQNSLLDIFPTANKMWGGSEGRWTADGDEFFGLVASSSTGLGIASYKISTNTIRSAYTFAQLDAVLGNGVPTTIPNNASINDQGTHGLVQWAPGGCWTFNLADPVNDQLKVYDTFPHMDWCTFANGDPGVVADVQGNDQSDVTPGAINARNIVTGVNTVYTTNQGYGSGKHLCGLYQGYALVSTFNKISAPEQWNERKIYWLRLSDGAIFMVSHAFGSLLLTPPATGQNPTPPARQMASSFWLMATRGTQI